MQQAIQNNKWWAIAVVVLIILNIATLATFWMIRSKEMIQKENLLPPKKDGAAMYLIEQLQFDSIQKKEFLFLKQTHQKGIRDTRNKLRHVKENFFDLLSDTTISEKDIIERSSEIASLEQEIEMLSFQHFQQVRKLCNAKQQEHFDAIIKDVLKLIAPPPPPPPSERMGRDGSKHNEPHGGQNPPPLNGEHPFPPPHKEMQP
ncbi:MAG: hypothetical protein ACOVNY_12735 [Chitinophagaceae bacterium]